jgi:pimeloyl-ACP methyl ester carboxylesterase
MSSPPFLELPGVATARRLETGRGVFAVHEATPPGGGERGTALLVPGYTGSKEDFIALLEPLAKSGYRVVAMDQRGQYETGGPRDEAAYAQPELALDVLAVTAAVAGSGPVHLLGHSFGGLVARAALLTHGPGPWASLTLMCSGPASIKESEAGKVRLLVDAVPTHSLEEIWQAMRAFDGAARTARVPVDIQDFLRERWLATVPEHLTAVGTQLIGEPDRVAELAAVPLPKLVLSGGTDYAWPVPSMDEMARVLRAPRAVIPDAGHSPNVESPAETASALVAFWDSVR